MTLVAERPQARETDLAERLAALKPGDVFSIDRPITVEEFCEHVSDEWHAELVNGVVYVMSPPSDPHEDLSGWLFATLYLYVRIRGLGKVRGGRSGVRITGTTVREPDLLFFQTSRLDRMTERGVHGAPDLAIEIVDSPKARREAVRKQAQYQEIGVAELWVPDLPLRELRHFVLEEGRYVRVSVDPDGEVVSRTVPGFRLKTAWFFAGPSFPDPLEIIQKLLSEADAQ